MSASSSGDAPVVVVTTTTASTEAARRIAEALLADRLAACVQVSPVDSHYRWDGAVRRDAEHLLQIKTTAPRIPRVEACILRHHGYELPEILVVAVAGGSAAYLAWVRDSVADPQ